MTEYQSLPKEEIIKRKARLGATADIVVGHRGYAQGTIDSITQRGIQVRICGHSHFVKWCNVLGIE